MTTAPFQPVYLLLDTSGSMQGEPIAAVNVGLASLVASLRSRSGLGERIHISLSTFDAVVKELVPLQPVTRLQLPSLEVPRSGPTFLGAALEAFIELRTNAPRSSHELPPMLFVMTDGSPTDIQIFEEALPKIRALGLGRIIAFAAGPKAKVSYLQMLSNEVIRLDTLNGSAFARMFDHVAHTIEVTTPSFLPPAPADIMVVV